MDKDRTTWANIIDGKALAAQTRARVKQGVARFYKATKIQPALAVVLVGDDAASQVYVKNKIKACDEVGIISREYILPSDTTQDALLKCVERLNNDTALHGLLVQFPMPSHISQQAVINAIDPAKDVDGLHPLNAGRLAAGLPTLTSCTPQGCLQLARSVVPDLTGKHVVIIGRSNLVGKPVAQLFLAANATIVMAHSHTRNLAALARAADILVAAAGVPHLVKGEWIGKGAVVIDVGIHRVVKDDGTTRLIGDVDFEAASANAAYITPVPGGVGPMTVAQLMHNTCVAAARQAGLAEAAVEDLFTA